MYPKVMFSSGLYESMDATENVLTQLIFDLLRTI